jgi:hypothetical protein
MFPTGETWQNPKSATELAHKLLKQDKYGLKELRVHMFELDGDEHDDELQEKLYFEFSCDFDRIQKELATAFGAPVRTGSEDDSVIPLNGVFRFVVWKIEGKTIFAAAAHEDRGLPILLMLGTVSGAEA